MSMSKHRGVVSHAQKGDGWAGVEGVQVSVAPCAVNAPGFSKNAIGSSDGSAQFDNLYARPLWTAANSSNVTKAVFATTTAATSISETAAPNAKSAAKGGVILVGNSGADTLVGGDGVDLIIGGGAVDTLKGGKEKDYLFGGAGNDILQCGLGSDIMDGGIDTDTADYTDFTTARTFTLTLGGFTYSAQRSINVTDSATGDVDELFGIENATLGVVIAANNNTPLIAARAG